MNEIL